jgi:UDP-N-acetylglucosamine/UDP-N-acetylgalactosamine diphosphorylase
MQLSTGNDMMTKAQLLARLQPFGQEHLPAFWDRLDAQQRESLARQIETIDFALVRRLYDARNQQADLREMLARAEPPPAFRLQSASGRLAAAGTAALPGADVPSAAQRAEAKQRAVAALTAGELGVVLVAGGQGTRLGFEHPKGMFPIGPISQKTLFQLHVEKIVAASRRFGARIPLYLMTSPATHDETVAFFAAHGRFGLPPGDLFIFCQGTMPAVDAETGRVLLDAPDRIAASPDGHGGLVDALRGSGAIEDIERRGIRHLFYFQVDNPLVDICGREFVGYHLLAGSEFSSQVVAKCDPLERVGNVVRVGDRLMVIEYSDLPDDAARRRNADGSLAIWAGSIAVHVIDVELLRRTAASAASLPFHVARKKAAYVDAGGRRVEPARPNALKFERFIFDLMPQARNAIVVEVDRATAFAPLKNASGAKEDTPESVRTQMCAMHRDWLRQAGAAVDDSILVEVSPLFALDADDLAARLPPCTQVTTPTYFV